MAKNARRRARRTAIERPLGGTEKIYWLLDKLYCLNFAAYAELDGELKAADLQDALAAVQEQNPLLRAHIRLDGKVPKFAPIEPEKYPLRPQICSLHGWRRQLEKQLDTEFEAGEAPLARCFWFRGKTKKSVVAMVFHHPIADGRSGVSVLLEVLQRAAGNRAPVHYRQARPSAQDLDLVRQHEPVKGKLKEIRFWLNKGKEVLRLASQLPGYDASPVPDRTSRAISLVIPRTRSAALVAACRANKTSVHGALGAAQVMAINGEFDVAKPRVMALNSLADLRGVLDGNLTEKDLGLYVSTLTTMHSLDAEPDFWQLAREVRDTLQQVIASGDADLIHSFYPQRTFFSADERGARKVQTIVAMAPPSSMLTNIGRVDQLELGDRLAVRGAGFLLSPPAQSPICVTATSYDGRMFLNLLYDASKLDRKQAERICARFASYIDAAAAGK